MSTPDMKDLMAQAQQMQKKMQEMQALLEKTEVTGESGGGLVKITMTCRHEVKKVMIADEAWKESHEIIEGLIIAAFNDTLRKVENTSREKIVNLGKEIGLPEN